VRAELQERATVDRCGWSVKGAKGREKDLGVVAGV